MEEYILTFQEQKQVDLLHKNLHDMDSVTKTLQRDSITVAEALLLFDAIIEKYPAAKFRLAPNADIFRDPHFESGIAKIQNNEVDFLTRAEKSAVKCLKKAACTAEAQDRTRNLFAEQAFKRRKLNENTAYHNLGFLLPTSNICERLFPKAGYWFSKRRKRTAPAMFEQQIFLHVNQSLWDISDISAIVYFVIE